MIPIKHLDLSYVVFRFLAHVACHQAVSSKRYSNQICV
jgi:hypothetical protein